MRKVLAVVAVLLPVVGQAQSINYYPAGGGGSHVVLCQDATQQPTTGTSEEVLATCSIPAATLVADGDMIRFSGFMSSAANGNSKTLKVRLGGVAGDTLLTYTGTFNNVGWWFEGQVFRDGTSAGWAVARGAVNGVAAVSNVSATTKDWSGALDLVVTGTTGTSAGDLIYQTWTVETVKN